MIIVRRRKLGNGSTRAIKQFLKDDHNKDIDIIRYDNNRKMLVNNRWVDAPELNDPFILRWGYTGEIGYDNAHTINTSEHIHLVNDKPECRKKLIESGIKVPLTFFSKEEVRNCLILGNRSYIGRPAHHAQGRKMVHIKTQEDLGRDTTSNYWSEVIDKDKEYRVYTFFGKIIMVAEKVPTEIGRERLAWNHFGGGAIFENVIWSKWPIEACKEALKASNAIGIDFAGVDVMVKNNKPFILEINSAHSLTSEYRQKTFANAMNWLINYIEENNSKPEHFEYPEHIKTFKSIILPCLRGR